MQNAKKSNRLCVFSRARSGSTAVMELLGSHPNIKNMGELLNSAVQILPSEQTDVLNFVNHQLSNSFSIADCEAIALGHVNGRKAAADCKLIAFKVLTCQMDSLQLRSDRLMRHCGVKNALIVWRQNTLEIIVSLKIAIKSGIWYKSLNNNKESQEFMKVTMPEKNLRFQIERDRSFWIQLFEHWPIEVVPLFIQYEELFANGEKEIADRFIPIYESIGVELHNGHKARCYALRQNPAPLKEKLANWEELPLELREYRLNVQALFHEVIEKRVGLPKTIANLLPEPEPKLRNNNNDGGILFRVAEPFIPTESIKHVNDALKNKSVSSAGVWPEKLAAMLKMLFKYPVALPCSNGFSAIVAALQSANIGNGCEVLLPTLTMVAVSNAVLYVGANPVFVDSSTEHTDYNPSWALLKAAATERTKAVILTHTYGCPAADTELIARECAARNWILIEDISECVGVHIQCSDGKQKLLGSFGDFSCASMYANKIVHSGDGGFILARDPSLEIRLQSVLNHGFTKSFHFVHFEQAMNAKINGLGAAMACGVLENLSFIMEHRKLLALWYRNLLTEIFDKGLLISMPKCGYNDTPWVFGVHCRSKQERRALRSFLAKNGIETRDYFFPLHLQPMFNGKYVDLHMPIAMALGSKCFYLPTHTNMTFENVCTITNAINEFFGISPREEIQRDKEGILVPICNEYDSANKKKCEELLSECRKCFMGNENWDERNKLVKILDKFFIHKEKKHGIEHIASIDELRAFYAYFSSSLNLYDNLDKGQNFISKKQYIQLYLDKWAFEEADLCNRQKVLLVLRDMSAEEVQKFYPDEMFANSLLTVEKLTIEELCKENWRRNLEPYPKGCYTNAKEAYFAIVDVVNEENQAQYRQIAEFLVNLNVHRLLLVSDCHIGAFIVPLMKFLTNGINKCFRTVSKMENLRYFERTIQNVSEETKSNWDQLQTIWNRPIPKKLNFLEGPDWSHHHMDAFGTAIRSLRAQLHDECSKVLFIPALEQYICDSISTPSQPWIGIIHSTIRNEEQFYVPDLNRLVTGIRFRAWFKNCAGLFTLTSTQRDFLVAKLRPDYSFPIMRIFYPSAAVVEDFVESPSNDYHQLAKCLQQPTDIYFIGAFDRDYAHFFNAKLPSKFRKVLLLSEDNKNYYSLGKEEMAVVAVEASVNVEQHASAERYEQILRTSIAFLSLREGGAANTLLIECIMRQTPIIAPKIDSVVDYIGAGYPLLFEKGQLDFTGWLSDERIADAKKYLKCMEKEFLTQQHFIHSIKNSSLLASLPSSRLLSHLNSSQYHFELSVLICCYRRTAHLKELLQRIVHGQKFAGEYEVILWNNNASRKLQRSSVDLR